MSVVSIINTDDAVHLLTDGGLFNRGVVERITNKARAFPHLNCAVSFRGTKGWWPFLIERIGYSFESFDDLVCGIADYFLDGINSILAGHQFHGEELWFCGWSDQRQRFEAYGISSHGLKQHIHGVASEPWALTRIDGNVIAPIDPTFYQRLATRPANTIEELGIAIAECQRQMIWENAHGDDEILVGAHIQLTTVTKDMISQKILKTWPDKGVKVSFFDTSAPIAELSADSGSGGSKGLVPAPAAGDAAAGKFLKADGTWSVTPGYKLRQTTVFTSSGTWTKQSWCKAVRATVVGGGGGGGGGATTTGASGGGGGGGGTSIKLIVADSLGSTESVTIGAAANGGASGATGTTGTATSFGSHCSATGGAAGGGVTDTTTISLGGAGGVGSGGDINIGGTGGHSSAGTGNSGRVPGNGGSSSHGGGGAAGTNAGGNGRNYGGGGAGGRRDASTDGNGGNGAAGIVIVEEYE